MSDLFFVSYSYTAEEMETGNKVSGIGCMQLVWTSIKNMDDINKLTDIAVKIFKSIHKDLKSPNLVITNWRRFEE